ncbi:ABC transporter ATP-binding protein [Halobacteria archaeon AArc-m2/3/4]|uniref:Molybdate/tungstate import ATP-binding protein WtpC n=1 Tax=Natronoglomus mannanivorans TaxID=2979990 RepID=A0ABT2QBA2_9EURY|nr:ABC transporter ATP-binding protein [Halobacteria archaeon AArc-m2/3/4]
MTDLTLEGVSKLYEETAALREVDLSVADGEFFTLVGPSGCGKTTTLRTIAGFEEPTSGSVRFDGEEMTGVPPEDRDVGVVFQNYALFPHMTVAENVGYGLRFRDPPAGTSRKERVSELLELVDLAGMGERQPSQLSGGQQQRVSLARALAPEPSLLLLDEPMSALDARLRETLRRQVKRIQSELEITTVYVTHDQAEALAISDRVAVMHAGNVEQVGTPKEIYRRPATRFVAEFVGDNNVFEGEVLERSGDEIRVRISSSEFVLPDSSGVGDAGTGLESGDRLTFCIRPEALTPTAETNRFPVTVETSEFLGESVRVHGRWNDTPIVLRLEEPPATEELTVGFAPNGAHVVEFDVDFDAEFE